jgi:hypothetical protein
VEDVRHVRAAGRGDAGEREHHHPDQGMVPQPYHAVRLDRAQQLMSCPSPASGAGLSRIARGCARARR